MPALLPILLRLEITGHDLQAGVVTVSGNLEVEPRLMLFLDISGAEQVR